MLDFCYQKTDTPAKPNQRLLEMATHTLAISDIREIRLALNNIWSVKKISRQFELPRIRTGDARPVALQLEPLQPLYPCVFFILSTNISQHFFLNNFHFQIIILR